MGIGSSDCYRCDDFDCCELIFCRISRNHEENEKEKESYDNASAYRNAISDPNLASKMGHDGAQSIQCCHNHLKECSHVKNQDNEFRCCCHSSCCNRGLSTPSCHSSTRSPASSGHRSNQHGPIFYRNIYEDRHFSGEQRRGPIPPFPPIESLTTGLNNSKSVSNSNLACKHRDVNVHHNQKSPESQKVLNTFQNFSRPAASFVHDAQSSSTCSGKSPEQLSKLYLFIPNPCFYKVIIRN